MPLPIELAAARAKVLAPHEIRDRLSDRFRFLTGGRGRHQTLRSTIDWSYDLLSENERALFRRLSVFAGSFDFAAVQALWPDADPLDHLEQLVTKSLVTVEQPSEERLRYRLLETLRQYGAERPAQVGETQDAQSRHFVHCLGVAERAYAQRIENEAASLAALEADHEISVRHCVGGVRVRENSLISLPHWGGFGICVRITAKGQCGWRKRSRSILTTVPARSRVLCGR